MKIIALTSVPARFDVLGDTLESLLGQQPAPDAIELYIPQSYRRFPEFSGEPPQVPPGVTIVTVGVDHGPATKILAPMQRHRTNPDAQILICNDDLVYPPNWANVLFQTQSRQPHEAVVALGRDLEGFSFRERFDRPRARLERSADVRGLVRSRPRYHLWGDIPPSRYATVLQSGFVDYFYGDGGIVLRPRFLPMFNLKIPEAIWRCPDIWLAGMLNDGCIGIWAERDVPMPREGQASTIAPLFADPHDARARIDQIWDAILYMRDHVHAWCGGRAGPPGAPIDENFNDG